MLTVTQNSFARYNLCGRGFLYALNLGHLMRLAIMTTSVNCIIFVGTQTLEHSQQTQHSVCLCTVRTTLLNLVGIAQTGETQHYKIWLRTESIVRVDLHSQWTLELKI